MRKHEGYKEIQNEVKEAIQESPVENADETRKEVLKRGRPRKVVMEI